MFAYAFKRIIRSRGLSLALFMSIVLASTLFSGILQGADAVGESILTKVLTTTKYDIITTNPYEKNVTLTNIYNINAFFKTNENVENVDHFLRHEIELNSTTVNGTVPTIIIALPISSSLVKGIQTPDVFQDGKLYIDIGSTNATKFKSGEQIDLGLLTYVPFQGILNFKRIYFPIEVGPQIVVDDQTWSLFLANSDGVSYYSNWVNLVISGNDDLGGRPKYNLAIVTENTYRVILQKLESNPTQQERRLPTIIHSVAAIKLGRGSIINQWDITSTENRLKQIDEQINGMGGVFSYIPDNILEKVLTGTSSRSAELKLNTILITIPVFFTAWYLGITVSDAALSQRRREIGLLLTRGFTHQQVFITFLYEALFLGLSSGIIGTLIGAAILPFVIRGLEFVPSLNYISPITFTATMIFSLVISSLAAYSPARKATKIEIVDAIRDYREEEEIQEGWTVPLMALLLGSYKLIFLLSKLNIESFRPNSGNFITYLLYSVWYGMDFILGFIWTLLLFWGFTKLFLQAAPQFNRLIGRLSERFVGEAAKFINLSSGRNIKRVGSYIFIVALIMSYSVAIIGESAITSDYLTRFTRASNGADASVSIYKKDTASSIANQIRELNGVESVAIEIIFNAETSLAIIPIRAIEVNRWDKTAYTDSLYINESEYTGLASNDSIIRNQFGVIQGANALFERGAAPFFGLSTNRTGYVNIGIGNKVYTLKIVGFFGRDLGENWIPQNPTVFVPLEFVENFQDEWISGVRLLIKLKPGVDTQSIATQIKLLSSDIQRVDLTSVLVQRTQSSIQYTGTLQEVQLGLIFAAAVSSIGVVLIVYMLLRSRSRELNLMSIRGYQKYQLSISLITENIGMTIFASILGITIGVVNLLGQIEFYNKYIPSYTSWRLEFPLVSQVQLALLFTSIVLATIIPIELVVRKISKKPNIKGEG